MRTDFAITRCFHITYKIPNRNIAIKPALRLLESCNVQTMDSGSTSIQKSRATLNTELET